MHQHQHQSLLLAKYDDDITCPSPIALVFTYWYFHEYSVPTQTCPLTTRSPHAIISRKKTAVDSAVGAGPPGEGPEE